VTTRLAGGIALTLVVVAVFLMAGSQTIAMIGFHNALAERRVAQESAMKEGGEVRNQLQAIVTGTEQLAARGDAAAKDVLETLRKQGIVITPRKP
jgi:hypothetical protein